MHEYLVTYEVRELNAVGIFWLKSDIVLADSPNQACERFRNRWAHKYEFRFPSSVQEIEKW